MMADPADPTFGPATAALDFHYDGDLALGRRGLRPRHPRVSVVVPAKHESENIREVLPYLSNYYGWSSSSVPTTMRRRGRAVSPALGEGCIKPARVKATR